MTDRTKKILYVSGFIVFTFALAYILYYIFFKATKITPIQEEFPPIFTGGLPGDVTPGQEVPGTITPPGELPITGFVIPSTQIATPTGPTISLKANGGTVVSSTLVNQNTNFVSKSTDGNGVKYYDTSSGLFSRVDKNGNTQLLSNRVFPNVQSVTWSKNDNQSVIEFNDGSNIIYNFDNNQSFTLPAQYEDFSFAPDGTSIAAKDLKLNDEDKWLVIVDNQGKNRQLIEHLGGNADRVQVEWNPNKRIIATTAKSIDANRAEVIFLTTNGEKLNKAIIQGRNLTYTYSPSGNRIAYSVYNTDSNYLPNLWLTSSDPTNIDSGRINTGINTWADKCDFAYENAIYCAVPNNIGEYSGILRDNNTSDDSIYKINPITGQATLIAQPIFPVQIQTLSVSKDGTTLFYTDKDTGAIEKFDL